MSLMRNIATVGGLTLLSRVSGFARDMLSAAVLGAGPVSDAFFVALKLPNFFRRFFAEGAFAAAFVPMVTRKLETEGAGAGRLFAGQALASLLAVVVPFTILVILTMPWVITLFAPGFAEEGAAVVDGVDRRALAIELSRITFPYLPLICAVALIGGVLNAVDRMAPFAAASILFNLTLITAMLGVYPFLAQEEDPLAAYALAWGVAAAGVVQLAWITWFARRARIMPSARRPRLNRDMARLAKLVGPGALGAGITQINLFVDMILASFLPTGAITYLYYADRLNQLPLGVVGIAIGTALLPQLSRRLAAEDGAGAAHAFSRALQVSLVLGLPAGVGLLILPDIIVQALFGRGEFEAEDVFQTAIALAAYALGLPAYILIKGLNTAYFARQNTLSPMLIGASVTGCNIALSLLFIFVVFPPDIGHVGIALATGLTGWIHVVWLGLALRRAGFFTLDRRARLALPGIVMATLIMAAVLLVLRTATGLFGWSALAEMIVLVGLGAAFYGSLVFILRGFAWDDLRGR